MDRLQNKNIVVGLTGSIACYKTIELVRLLRKAQANVRVVLTPSASEFVTPLTLQAISGNAVSESLFDLNAEQAMGHIALAKWADAVVIAPATADFIARLRLGMANDLLSTLCLATTAPILLAPAMNQQMFCQLATQENLQVLTQRGVQIIAPTAGSQACGDVGIGRMAEPLDILAEVSFLFSLQDCSGLSVLITLGATREAIDPVRFLTNHSSGKMGVALAKAFIRRGAKVRVIAGSVSVPIPQQIQREDVVSAEEMYQVVQQYVPESDIFIACAAVADFRVKAVSKEKLKKDPLLPNEEMQLTLVKNPDIVASVAQMTCHRPFVVGFAAETENVATYAKDKLIRKNLDMICANDVSRGQGFNQNKNALQLFWQCKDNVIEEQHLTFKDKDRLADDVVAVILARLRSISLM